MKNINIILTIILLIMAGCTGSQQQTDGLITVDVTKSYPKKELILQDFLDVEYIPLETSDEFITTAHIQAISKEFITVRNLVWDGNIYLFNRKTGKALRKINRKGQSAEEYVYPQKVSLDEDSNEMYVNDNNLRKILVYDLSGKFKRSFEFREKAVYSRIYHFDRDNLIYIDRAKNHQNKFAIISKQDGSVTKEIPVPYEKKIETTVRVINETGSDIAALLNEELIPYRDSWILAEPSADTIYRYSPDHTMKPIIARTPSIRSMNPEVFLFLSMATDRYYFMDVVKKEFDWNTSQGFPETDLVYDKQEKNIYEYTIYNDDYVNKKATSIKTTPLNKEIISHQILQAFDLVEAYGKGQLKGRLKEIAATLNEESNPVIMLVKHKNKSIRERYELNMIPKIIHQIWEGRTRYLGDVYNSLGETWKEHHPDWKYEFWNENRMENLVYNYFPEMLDIYFGYPYTVQRWHVIRYLILYQMGGMYVDFDYECLESFDKYITDESKCYFAMEPEEHHYFPGKNIYFNNALMVSPPGHPFFKHIITQLQTTSMSYTGDKYWEVLNSTGLLMLTNLYEKYTYKNTVDIFPTELVSPFSKNEVQNYIQGKTDEELLEKKMQKAIAVHYFKGSWLIKNDIHSLPKDNVTHMPVSDLYQLFMQYPNICINSQEISLNSLFFAIQTYTKDGNKFAKEALAAECRYAIVDDPEVITDDRYILVDNVLEMLHHLAAHHHQILKTPVIGITGTCGKTTTKELIVAVLSTKYNLVFTPESENSTLTLYRNSKNG